MTLAVGAVGASLAFVTPALAASPSHLHVRAGRHATHAFARSAATATTGAVEYVTTTGNDTNANGTANTCRISTNPCATITHALAVAPPTGTIKVGSGTYPEQLNVITNTTIVGTGTGSSGTIIQPTSLATDTNDPNGGGNPEAVIVTFAGTSSGGLSNLTVDGSATTEPSEDGCGLDYVGVEFANASGTLSGDTVANVHESPDYFGCQPGADGGVYVANDDGANHTVTMTKLAVSNYDKDGITCVNAGTTCNISNSAVTGIGNTDLTAQNGIEIYGANGSVKSTTVTGNSYDSPQYTGPGSSYTEAAGILAFGAGNLTLSSDTVTGNDVNVYAAADQNGDIDGGIPQGAWSIINNKLTGATNMTGQSNAGYPTSVPVPLDQGVGDGLDLDGASGNVTVAHNTVTGNADWGIALFATSYSTIGGATKAQANTISGNGASGVYVGEGQGIAVGTGPSASNTVQDNTIQKNGQDGIFAAGLDSNGNAQDANNQFLNNSLFNNVRYDALDQSMGGGTAGTNNTWTSNVCKPAQDSSPLGLCMN